MNDSHAINLGTTATSTPLPGPRPRDPRLRTQASTAAAAVQFVRVNLPYHILRGRGDVKREPGIIVARVDGHTSILREGRGWRCDCPARICDHPNQVAAHVDPEILHTLESTPLRRHTTSKNRSTKR